MSIDQHAVRRSIAASVDAPVALLPHFHQLFDGMDSLGSSPRVIARLLAAHGVGSQHRVIDLACGKGSLAVEIARKNKSRVIGVDACEPFIHSARALARRHGVSERCRFEVGDVHQQSRSRFDAALMMGLLPLDRAAVLLRRMVRPRGLYFIDDCWWDDRLAPPPDARCFTQEQSIAIIESLGDHVLELITPTPSAIRALNERLYQRLKHNASAIAREHPRLRPHLREFLKRQRDANKILGGVLRPAVWIIQRA